MSSAAVIDQKIVQNVLPARLPPWSENPYGLVSLWLMLQLYANTIVGSSANLAKLWLGLRLGGTLDERGVDDLATALGDMKRECGKHGFHSSLNQIERIEEHINRRNLSGEELGQLVLRIHEDLQAELFLHVPKDRISYYKAKDPLFGVEVANRFPSVSFDVAEAGKCYALHRSTACVFHLMRVLEIGLAALAARFGVPADHTNWQNIIERTEKAIRGMASDPHRPSDWKDQQEFYSQAASHFMIFKDAWRNYTAHARGKFTEEEAGILMLNIRSFMEKLATRLHE
jgi:hypothetical protein